MRTIKSPISSKVGSTISKQVRSKQQLRSNSINEVVAVAVALIIERIILRSSLPSFSYMRDALSDVAVLSHECRRAH